MSHRPHQTSISLIHPSKENHTVTVHPNYDNQAKMQLRPKIKHICTQQCLQRRAAAVGMSSEGSSEDMPTAVYTAHILHILCSTAYILIVL